VFGAHTPRRSTPTAWTLGQSAGDATVIVAINEQVLEEGVLKLVLEGSRLS
jgi:hypothetical protein